jgi:hypothetical protein
MVEMDMFPAIHIPDHRDDWDPGDYATYCAAIKGLADYLIRKFGKGIELHVAWNSFFRPASRPFSCCCINAAAGLFIALIFTWLHWFRDLAEVVQQGHPAALMH